MRKELEAIRDKLIVLHERAEAFQDSENDDTVSKY